VVLAPDSFKGSATAPEVARALADGWRQEHPDDELIELPLADGGEGTLDVLAAAHPTAAWRPLRVGGPDGRPVDAGWLRLPDGTAVVELARAAGLPQLSTLDPLGATTHGVGELLRSAAAEATRIVVALGGSATTDGGTGALVALGARLLDARGRPLAPGGGALAQLSTVEPVTVAPPEGGVTCLVDVTAPLLGPLGAAAQFGPQKGATPADVDVLERGLARLAAVLGGDPDQPGAGAAGGTAYGLVTAWSAVLAPGAATVAETAGLPKALATADLVVTGEGRFDEQSGRGKLVGHVIDAARAAGVRAAVVAGAVTTPPPPGVSSVELVALAGSADAALADARRWLTLAGAHLARGA
jgi:glycerate kinase